MSDKLKIIDNNTWEQSERLWDEKAKNYRQNHPIKTLSKLPQMPGIVSSDARFLKGKSLWYLLRYDKEKIFLRHFFKHPIKYAVSLLKSYLKAKSYHREGDFFFYGLQNEEEFKNLLEKPDSLLVVGFSYCHKPFECPSGRFTDQCIHDPDHPVCGQCFIGKTVHFLPDKQVIPLFIPTIHYIGDKIFELVHKYPEKQILFLITACEMTLEMFGDWGNMVGAKGIGVRLDGRICNTMQAFKLSEEGIKPGLTVVLDGTQKRILELFKSCLPSHSDTTS